MPVYGYSRVSSAEQAKGTSLEDQARVIQGVALVRNESLARVFQEPGVSGSIPLEERPVGRELVAHLKSGDVLITAKLDRAFRSAADALQKAEAWKKQGIKLIVADLGVDPVTDNGVSKLFFTILAGVAEFENARRRERVVNGRRAKREKAGYLGGPVPFGYRVVGEGKESRLKPVAEQQAALATIRKLCGSTPLRKIVYEVRWRHGLTITHETVRKICRQL